MYPEAIPNTEEQNTHMKVNTASPIAAFIAPTIFTPSKFHPFEELETTLLKNWRESRRIGEGGGSLNCVSLCDATRMHSRERETEEKEIKKGVV